MWWVGRWAGAADATPAKKKDEEGLLGERLGKLSRGPLDDASFFFRQRRKKGEEGRLN